MPLAHFVIILHMGPIASDGVRGGVLLWVESIVSRCVTVLAHYVTIDINLAILGYHEIYSVFSCNVSKFIGSQLLC